MTEIVDQAFPAKVIDVIDSYRIAINRGLDHGVQKGQRFLIYSLGKELFDPDSKESLGRLEIVCGTGKVSHVQNKIATITSDMRGASRKKIIRPNPYGAYSYRNEEVIEETGSMEPFEGPTMGSFAKPI
jgi:hypothetical protein